MSQLCSIPTPINLYTSDPRSRPSPQRHLLLLLLLLHPCPVSCSPSPQQTCSGAMIYPPTGLHAYSSCKSIKTCQECFSLPRFAKCNLSWRGWGGGGCSSGDWNGANKWSLITCVGPVVRYLKSAFFIFCTVNCSWFQRDSESCCSLPLVCWAVLLWTAAGCSRNTYSQIKSVNTQYPLRPRSIRLFLCFHGLRQKWGQNDSFYSL